MRRKLSNRRFDFVKGFYLNAKFQPVTECENEAKNEGKDDYISALVKVYLDGDSSDSLSPSTSSSSSSSPSSSENSQSETPFNLKQQVNLAIFELINF